jgi:PucR family transcriptional regulator, purine catabolism regulatory protein
MAITVSELVAIPYLGTRVHAGAAGLGRSVTWAHACEVPEPWNWLDEGDLLMTNGYSLPTEPEGQVAFVRELAKAGISAVAIGEQRHAPAITPEMTTAADELGLPVLLTAYAVPFIAVARAVAGANHREEQARLLQTVRVYDRLRESALGEVAELLERLGDELSADLHVLDPERASEILPGRAQPSDDVAQATRTLVSGLTGPLPALSRIEAGGRAGLIVPVPAQRPTLLLALARASRRPDLALLQHVATIVAVQVERLAAEREQERRLGAELLAQIIDGRIDVSAAEHQLDGRGIGREPLLLVACSDGGGRNASALHHRLTERGVAHLLLLRTATLFVALPDCPSALDALREELDSGVRCGISDPFRGAARAPDAAREAQWAMQAAESKRRGVMRYGEDGPLFMPRTLSEAREAVRKVLGPVLDYDEATDSSLVDSLREFLTCNRSWQRASAKLYVHKQTLVYRMRRVEELTQRRLDDTGNVAELWLALRALEVIAAEGGDADRVAA